ncbi:flagellar biosynthesis protein FlgD, partial [bacterium]|nr:flagellar biosynthesis protein FlgD [bacterium]
MPDISNISNDVLNSISIARTQEESSATNDASALGKDAFLRLMVAQLQNQDPLNPAENGEFMSQLAQFSSVEGIQNINES